MSLKLYNKPRKYHKNGSFFQNSFPTRVETDLQIKMGLIHILKGLERSREKFEGKDGIKKHCPELWDLILEHKGVFTIHEDHVHFPRANQLCHKCHNCNYCSQILLDYWSIQTLKVENLPETKIEMTIKEHCPELWDLILEHEGVFIAHEDHVHVSEDLECHSSTGVHSCEYCTLTLTDTVPIQAIIDYYENSVEMVSVKDNSNSVIPRFLTKEIDVVWENLPKIELENSTTILSTDSRKESNMSVKEFSFLPSDKLENNSKVENINNKVELAELVLIQPKINIEISPNIDNDKEDTDGKLESDEHRKSPPPSDYDLEDNLENNSNIVKIEMTRNIGKSKIDKSTTSLSTDSMEESNMSVKGSSCLPSDTLENNSKVDNDKEDTNGKLETDEHRKIPAISQNDKAAHYDIKIEVSQNNKAAQYDIIEDHDETLEFDEDDYVLSCPVCEEMFPEMTALINHCNTAHYDIIEDNDEALEVEKSLKNSGQDVVQTSNIQSTNLFEKKNNVEV